MKSRTKHSNRHDDMVGVSCTIVRTASNYLSATSWYIQMPTRCAHVEKLAANQPCNTDGRVTLLKTPHTSLPSAAEYVAVCVEIRTTTATHPTAIVTKFALHVILHTSQCVAPRSIYLPPQPPPRGTLFYRYFTHLHCVGAALQINERLAEVAPRAVPAAHHRRDEKGGGNVRVNDRPG